MAGEPFRKTEKGELEKIQRRGATFVFNKYIRTSSVTDMLLDWVPLSERRCGARLAMMSNR